MTMLHCTPVTMGQTAVWTRPRPATCGLQDIKASIKNKVHVNAYSAALQKTAKKIMNKYAEYERIDAEYAMNHAKYAK